MTEPVVLACLVLGGMATAAVSAWWRPAGAAPAVLAALSLAWLLVNGPLEGPVLWGITDQHGLTLADLLTPVALLGAMLARSRATRRPVAADTGRR